MTTLGETPGLGEDILAADPSVLSTEVPDYSHVPPAIDFHSPTDVVRNADDSRATNQDSSTSVSNLWDYGQKGGADFNMEAPILEEDVIRAGGLGARDELDSFLPAAVDATDYEESLKDAMEYEDVQPAREGEILRPGVGFVKDQQPQRSDEFNETQQE